MKDLNIMTNTEIKCMHRTYVTQFQHSDAQKCVQICKSQSFILINVIADASLIAIMCVQACLNACMHHAQVTVSVHTVIQVVDRAHAGQMRAKAHARIIKHALTTAWNTQNDA
jgi:hypothetical protein